MNSDGLYPRPLDRGRIVYAAIFPLQLQIETIRAFVGFEFQAGLRARLGKSRVIFIQGFPVVGIIDDLYAWRGRKI